MLQCTLLLTLLTTSHAWVLQSNVKQVTPGHTPNVHLECHYDLGDDGDAFNLNKISRIRITKLDPFGVQGTFAEIRENSPPNVKAGDETAVTGSLNELEEAFLKITWSKANESTTGAYGCEISGFDQVGNFGKVNAKYALIKEKILTMDDVENRIRAMTERFEKRQRSLESENEKLKAFFQNGLETLQKEVAKNVERFKTEIKEVSEYTASWCASKHDLAEEVSLLQDATKAVRLNHKGHEERVNDLNNTLQGLLTQSKFLESQHRVLSVTCRDTCTSPSTGTPTPATSTIVPTAPKSTTPISTTPISTTPISTTPDSTTPKATTPKSTTPKATTPKSTTPESTTPETTTPKATTPKAATPKATTPESTTPTPTFPVSTTPTPPTTMKATTPTTTSPPPLTWPDGHYGLVKTAYGCPRFKSPSQSDPVSAFSHSLRFVVETKTSKNVDLRHCWQNGASSSSQAWPRGSYCILSKTRDCPSGFKAGAIEFIRSIIVYSRKAKLNYCCRSDGVAQTPIRLPTGSAFYLMRYGGRCQSVAGMSTIEGHIWVRRRFPMSYYYTRESGSHPDVTHFHFAITGVDSIRVCRYQA